MFALLQGFTAPDGAPAACTAFCLALGDVLGPTIANLVLGAAALGLVYWKTTRKIAAVSAKADQAEERAKTATSDANDAKQQLEVLRSSLRPPSEAHPKWSIEPGEISLNPSSGSSGSSGNYPAIREVEITGRLPSPARMPKDAPPDVRPVPPREDDKGKR